MAGWKKEILQPMLFIGGVLDGERREVTEPMPIFQASKLGSVGFENETYHLHILNTDGDGKQIAVYVHERMFDIDWLKELIRRYPVAPTRI